MEEPVFNDIIPRTRAERVSQLSWTLQNRVLQVAQYSLFEHVNLTHLTNILGSNER